MATSSKPESTPKASDPAEVKPSAEVAVAGDGFPATPETQYVRYIGGATVRIIEAKDWETVGAEDQPRTEWGFQNDFQVPLDEFSSEALAYLKRDGRFTVVTV